MNRAYPLLALAAVSALLPSTAQAAEPDIDAVWNGDNAMRHVSRLVGFGPRFVGAEGHKKAADFIISFMRELPSTVVDVQPGHYHKGGKPDGEKMPLFNIIARFDPDNPRRVIVATHYDSIIRAWNDKENPEAEMPGANNSASGVAVLLETARALAMADVPPPLGIDFLFFDAEEGSLSLGASDPDWSAIGSEWYAKRIRYAYPDKLPEKAVVLDMVCDKDLLLRPEPNSLKMKKSREEAEKFWKEGSKFFPRAYDAKPLPYGIGDDHFALLSKGIPAFLVIDFDYRWYNTAHDTPDKCSAASLEAVGRTLFRYLYL